MPGMVGGSEALCSRRAFGLGGSAWPPPTAGEGTVQVSSSPWWSHHRWSLLSGLS